MHTARNASLRVSVHEGLALPFHDMHFFLGHRTAENIRAAVGITGQRADDLHDLLLVDNASVGGLEDRFLLRTFIVHEVRIIFSLDIIRDKIHRTRPVKRNAGDDVLQRLRLQLLHKALHAGRLELEDALALTLADHLHDLRIVIIDGGEIDLLAGPLLSHLHGILDHRQRAQAQEVHLQQTELFELRHVVLRCHGSIYGRLQRHKFINRLGGDDDAGRVHGGVAWQSLQLHGHVDQVMHFLIFLISLFQLTVLFQSPFDGDVQLIRDHLRYLVAEGIRQIQRTAHIADGVFRRHRSEGDDLYDTFLAVLSHYIVNDLLPPLIAEIHVDIRHGDSLRIQESLKQQVIAERIQFSDIHRIGDDRACGRATARSDRDARFLREMHIIPYDQKVIHVAHVVYGIQFVAETFADDRLLLRGCIFCLRVSSSRFPHSCCADCTRLLLLS